MRTCPKCSAHQPPLYRPYLPIWQCQDCKTFLIPNDRRMNLVWGLSIGLLVMVIIVSFWVPPFVRDLIGVAALAIVVICIIAAMRSLPLVVFTNRKRRERTELMKLGALAPIGYGVMKLLEGIWGWGWVNLIVGAVGITLGVLAWRARRALAREPYSPENE